MARGEPAPVNTRTTAEIGHEVARAGAARCLRGGEGPQILRSAGVVHREQRRRQENGEREEGESQHGGKERRASLQRKRAAAKRLAGSSASLTPQA
jgi:hypothetical protein